MAVYRNVPHFLQDFGEAVRAVNDGEHRPPVEPIDNWAAMTIGFRVGGTTFELPLSVWRRHYGAHRFDQAAQLDALARWRADLRKLHVPLSEVDPATSRGLLAAADRVDDAA
jgi:hypothetical protein